MSLPHLSLADARNLHLAAQGLLNKPHRRASLEDIPATISRMSLLQIDTINIVARSPYLVLFSRLGNYPAQWLDESLAPRKTRLLQGFPGPVREGAIPFPVRPGFAEIVLTFRKGGCPWRSMRTM